MANSNISGMAPPNRTVDPIRLYSESQADRLGDRFTRVWEVFRQKSSPEEEVIIGRSENPQKFEEIRNLAYLDIHRTIR
jgi:hypothetical protein